MMNTAFVRLNTGFFDLQLERKTTKHVQSLLNLPQCLVQSTHVSRSSLYSTIDPTAKIFILSIPTDIDCFAQVSEITDDYRYASIKGLGRNVQSFALSVCAAMALAEQNCEPILDSGLGLGEPCSIEEIYQKYAVQVSSDCFRTQAIRAFTENYNDLGRTSGHAKF